MEYTTIKALLEKYWSAETTVEEEKLLADYFRGPVIAPDLEPYRDLFGWFGEEAAIAASDGLEEKILESIRRADQMQPAASGQSAGHNAHDLARSSPAIIRPLYGKSSWIAAASLILLTLGVTLFTQPTKKDGSGVQVAQTDSNNRHSGNMIVLADNIKDTYDDPQQALAAIRRALVKASVKMNKGKNITGQEMNRMNDSWQLAIRN